MNPTAVAVLYATLAGCTIPLGGLLARIGGFQTGWLEEEFRHSVLAFGGGVLLAAVALVLVPQGFDRVSLGLALAMFGAGGIVFFAVDRAIEGRGGSVAQLLVMLLDFIPEAMAMGAMLTAKNNVGPLLALLIAFQNLPEGFNAYRELEAANRLNPRTILIAFCLIVLVGPLAAVLGLHYLAGMPEVLGSIMLFAAGGILYLTFQDVAPQAYLERHWGPSLGAVAGFMVGLLGHGLLG